MQPLLLFFIDGANLIDSKEPEWDMLLAVHTKGEAVTVVRSPSIVSGLHRSPHLQCYQASGSGTATAILHRQHSFDTQQGAWLGHPASGA